jgi:NhaC family Na+:H+ antiporter
MYDNFSGLAMNIPKKKIHWASALFAITSTLIILMYQIFIVGGAPHIPLVFGIFITVIIGKLHGYTWDEMQDGLVRNVSTSIPVLGIFMVVGMTIGTWILCGTVPLLTMLGLTILSPALFLPAACIICSVVSVFTGTSWGTVGTMGLALLGIGDSMGIPLYVTAGAIVSGAWFGDKMSPLSDTTNFAAAIVGINLYDHIRNMLPSTIPAMSIALLIYTFLGFEYSEQAIDDAQLKVLEQVLSEHFNFNILLLLPPIVIAITIWKKIAPLPSMFLGVISAILVAVFIQEASFGDVTTTMMTGYNANTGNPQVDILLSKGGIMSMMWVISLIMVAMAYGGVLEKTGCLDSLVHQVMKKIKGQFTLVMTMLLAVFGFNLVSNAFIAYTITGRMFTPAFRGRGLSASNASRLIEDGATMSAPLIPWNSGAVFVSGTLGVPTILYAPFAFANWITPIFDLIWGYTGYFMPKVSSEELQRWKLLDEPIFIKGQTIPASRVNFEKILIQSK